MINASSTAIWLSGGTLLLYFFAPLVLGWLAFRLGPRGAWLRHLLTRMNGYEPLGDHGVVFQRDSTSCGEACTEMVLRARRPSAREGGLSELRSMVGTSMLDLRDSLGRRGIDANGERFSSLGELGQRVSDGCLAVASVDISFHLGGENRLLRPWWWVVQRLLRGGLGRLRHWVLVTGMPSPDTLELADPFLGRLAVPIGSFERTWNGVALVVAGEIPCTA